MIFKNNIKATAF